MGRPWLKPGMVFFRMESDEDSDAPDSIVPASSPESVLGDEAPRFPRLAEVKQEEDERAISPVIPIIPRSSIPGTSAAAFAALTLPTQCRECQGLVISCHNVTELCL